MSPRKPLAERNRFRVGLAAFAGLAVLALIVVLISVVPFGKRTYTAMLEQTAGLKPGEQVQVSGVPVGKVRDVALDGNHVRIRFTVNRGVHLGARTSATVKVATLLGTHFLEVSPRGGGDLKDGVIPLSRTTVPFNLQDVLERGNAKIEQLDPKLLAQMMTVLSDQLGSSSDDIAPALAGVARLTDLVDRRGTQAGALLTAARSVTAQLSQSSVDVLALMRQTNLVVAEITSRREAIHRLLVEATGLSRNLTALIGETRADLSPALANVDRLLRTLHGQDRMLRQVLATMAPAVRYVANATGNGPYLDLDAQGPVVPPDDVTCKAKGLC